MSDERAVCRDAAVKLRAFVAASLECAPDDPRIEALIQQIVKATCETLKTENLIHYKQSSLRRQPK